MVLSKSGEEASQISEQALADALGGIPEYNMRCSNLAPKAIENWKLLHPEDAGAHHMDAGTHHL